MRGQTEYQLFFKASINVLNSLLDIWTLWAPVPAVIIGNWTAISFIEVLFNCSVDVIVLRSLGAFTGLPDANEKTAASAIENKLGMVGWFKPFW